MSDLILYNYFRSSTSYRTRIALELKELKYEYRPISLLNGEQHSDLYRKLNPIGGVPCLIHNGQNIAQSFAIIEYLEEAFPTTKPLLPQDPLLRAKIRQFCETINADIHPLQNLKVTKYLETNLNANSDQKAAWLQKWIGEGLAALEKILDSYSGKFCFGDSITVADAFLIPQLFSAERFGVNPAQFKKLKGINDNCLELEAFKRAHPFRQIDTPEEFKIS